MSSKIKDLLRKEGPLSWRDLKTRLNCPKASLTKTLETLIDDGTIVRALKNKSIVYALAPSQIQLRLQKLIKNAVESFSFYPLETVSTSYSTLSYRKYSVATLTADGINSLLQQQFSQELSRITSHYKENEQLRLRKILGKVALKGLNICVRQPDHPSHGDVGKKLKSQLLENPEKRLQITKNLGLFLELGLGKLSPIFTRNKGPLRLLALELQRKITLEFPPETLSFKQLFKSPGFSRREKDFLESFLEKVRQIHFMLILPFGLPDLEKPHVVNTAESYEHFASWMERLKSGTLHIKHANFLFVRGARNVKEFINALRQPGVPWIDGSIRKPRLDRLLSQVNYSPMEVNLKLVVDLREPWDLKFIYKNHPQGKNPKFYEEILSLIDVRRTEAKEKRWLDIPDGKSISKMMMTSKGFLIYRKGQKQPEVVGPMANTDDQGPFS